jgi:hypothetical protein
MKKQIKEMALAVCKNVMPSGNCHKDDMPCDLECVYGVCAQRLYNAGYRKQEWHKVSDELPKTSGLYIVCTDKGSVFTAHYYADCGRFNAPFKKSVLRWTEMPEAPREG